ncbi:putative repeat protein (TIGR02543 family) [Desulfitobacterium sp. LBE]|uniref:cell wall-binding repeat-containing protein n=1 Tax=Desulfitobacterium sp. LBE TaxID=884086 RepID=UPI00119AA6FD|nr:cell wall-binding repeat-containing protein [Desulfitobacterium sp. LBE]TWH58520.1 putative repeat protein (TIGR02543 family) [Desulfitobacterium sp. LBE]
MYTNLIKKTMTILLTLCLVLGMIPGHGVYVLAATNVPTGNYTISSNGDYQLDAGYSGKITIAKTVTAVRIIGNGAHTNTSISVESGRSSALELTIEDLNITAPVSGGNSGEHGIDFSNTGNYGHKLWLKGNCSITGDQAGIAVNDGVQLTIDKAADVANDADAVLTVLGKNGSAAIGGYYKNNHTDYGSCGEITINGGTINATGAAAYPNFVYGAAGIGGSLISVQGFTKGGTITINGGIITATGGEAAAGIGGGMGFNYNGASQGIITINGGTVVASGNKTGAGIGGGNTGGGYIININGGTITANGSADMEEGAGAGIGSSSFGFGSPTIVNISGGTITATGGTNSNFGGSGIGSGYLSEQGTINITGGSITAIGGSNGGAGIGGTSGNNGEKVTISGNPLVKAFAGTGAEDIGKGKGMGGSSGTLKNGTDDWVYLKFHVTKEGSNVAGATININSSQYTTDAGGYAYCFAPKSNTAYTIDAAGCQQASGTASNAKISNLVNVTMTAAVTYTVTFESNGGSAVAAIPNVVENSTVALPAPPAKVGYSFAGWYIDNDTFADEFTAGTFVTSNLTVYAKWTPLPPATYTVSFESNGGSTVAAIPNVAENNTVALPTPPPTKAGYSFAGWYIDNDTFADEFTAITPVTGNLTVYAKWATLPTDDSSDRDDSTSPSTPTPPSTPPATVTGNVKDGATGGTVSNVTATVAKDSHNQITLTLPAAQIAVTKQPDGTITPLLDLAKVVITKDTGTQLSISANGTFQIANLAQGTDHTFKIGYDLGNGQKITIGTMDITVDPSGSVKLDVTLIDPYGIITDGRTGKTLAGAKVTLYYADTARNKAVGKTPGTLVELPPLEEFKPNQNINPQNSDPSGAYGFMVFPESDYYLVANKEGYEEYKSPTISVEQDLVKWDFKMNQPLLGIKRLAGPTRVDTALEIAKATFTAKVKHVILATAANYPDALAGSVLAYKLNAPILLIDSSSEEQEKVLEYISMNLDSAGTVHILGGKGIVGSEIEEKIKARGFTKITRIGGKDRYETALKIAEYLEVPQGTPVVLVYGEDYPDALSISSSAAAMQSPILLVGRNEIRPEISQALQKIKPIKVYILGREGKISSAVEKQVAEAAGLGADKIVRIGGTDRYETALKIAQYFNLSGQNVSIATGRNFPDALAGSIYAANHNSPLLLCDEELSEEAAAYLRTRAITGGTLFGGEGAVSKAVEEMLKEIIGK